MIKEVKINRSKDGYWTHPDYPEWEEYVNKYEIKRFEEKNKINIYFTYFELTATDLDLENYFDNGCNDISNWQPKCSLENSFLLSIIHDTEDSLVAVFAVKTKQRILLEQAEKIKNF